MEHSLHERLIADLEALVAAGPPTTGHLQPHFKAAWALIRKIGPAFRETRYPRLARRDAAWDRFQAATDALKAAQRLWEERSAALRSEVLALVAGGRPGALRRFNAVKHELSHGDFTAVSKALREARLAAEAAGTAGAEAGRGREGGAGAARAAVRAPSRRRLLEEIESDEACLSLKRTSLAGFERMLEAAADPAERERIQNWITDARAMIAELETALAALRERLAGAGGG